VVSWGRGCGSALPGVYSRVAAFSDWIGETMTVNAGPVTPKPDDEELLADEPLSVDTPEEDETWPHPPPPVRP
jgi:secreted trypsin-like serine protease